MSSNAPTIGELVEARQRLEVWCHATRCGRTRMIAPEEAVALLGASTTFVQARERLVCSACGAKGSDSMIGCRGSILDVYAKLRAAGHMGG